MRIGGLMCLDELKLEVCSILWVLRPSIGLNKIAELQILCKVPSR